jgi:hypothetical protein
LLRTRWETLFAPSNPARVAPAWLGMGKKIERTLGLVRTITTVV